MDVCDLLQYRSVEMEISERSLSQNLEWLEKGKGWPSGEYRVEIYSGDDSLEQLAFGRYAVDPTLETREPEETHAGN